MDMHPRPIILTFLTLAALAVACNVGSAPPTSDNAPEASPAQAGSPAPGEPLPLPRIFPAEPGGPRLFFTDIESGPATGGEGGLGVFMTLYGEGFGPQRGDSTVTLGGHDVAAYPQWGENNTLARGLDSIIVQLGPENSTGDLIVNVGGVPSNALSFEVRPGRVLFISPSGSDEADGSFASPWATVLRARSSVEPGDTVYLMDGIAQTTEDNSSASLALEASGQPGLPIAFVAYPGTHPVIGTIDLEFGTRIPNNPDTYASHWVFAGLTLRGLVSALDLGGSGSTDWRIVGNDISCPSGDGQTGCFAAALASHVLFYGNLVHDIGVDSPQQPSKQYHAVYFTTDTNHVDAGWNEIRNNRTCRAIQVHSSPLCVPDCGPSDTTGFNQYDVLIHDNWINRDTCDGIVLATVDPSQGPVRVYNNILVHVGAGPHPPDGEANYSCIYIAGGTNTGADGRGVVEVSNNTCYDVGSVDPSWADAGAFGRGPGSPNLVMELRNNIVLTLPSQPYFTASTDASLVRGEANLWFGSGPGPDFLTGNLNADPRFVDATGFDFHLLPDSPAIDAGVDAGLGYDFAGLFRPLGEGFDLGAYEFDAGH
jgi:hypothetical protein